MNCTVCGKPVEEHLEGRETDFCIGLATGLIKKVSKGWYEIKKPTRSQTRQEKDTSLKARKKEIVMFGYPDSWLPHYSSPSMSPETWGLLTEAYKDSRVIYVGVSTNDNSIVWGAQILFIDKQFEAYAPTPTLAVCRAFLAKEEK